MKQFQAKFKVNTNNAVFIFTHMFTTKGDAFYIIASLGKEIIPFYMIKGENNHWEIRDDVPGWIKSAEDLLSEIINENL